MALQIKYLSESWVLYLVNEKELTNGFVKCRFPCGIFRAKRQQEIPPVLRLSNIIFLTSEKFVL